MLVSCLLIVGVSLCLCKSCSLLFLQKVELRLLNKIIVCLQIVCFLWVVFAKPHSNDITILQEMWVLSHINVCSPHKYLFLSFLATSLFNHGVRINESPLKFIWHKLAEINVVPIWYSINRACKRLECLYRRKALILRPGKPMLRLLSVGS